MGRIKVGLILVLLLISVGIKLVISVTETLEIDHCATEKPHLIGTLTSRSTAGVWFIQLTEQIDRSTTPSLENPFLGS